jgi:sterol desaturase/sphingolipid hydroxylase (fatty acid hydroxylase superfamily)
MKNLVATLEPLTPVIIIAGLAFFMTLETLLPFVKHSAYRKKQKWHNIGNILLSFVFNALLSGIISTSIQYADKSQFGLLHMLDLPLWAGLATGILLCDLNSYIAHRLYHRIPLFWRFHRVHHSDTELDASSALRLHPFEFIFQALTQATILPLLGVSFASFVLYFTFALPLFIVNHANLKFPAWLDKLFSILFITPNWHRVHHSSYRPETDSNFGDVFSIWDRIFRTQKRVDPDKLQYGLEEFRGVKDQTFMGQLMMPFKK